MTACLPTGAPPLKMGRAELAGAGPTSSADEEAQGTAAFHAMKIPFRTVLS